MEEFKYLIPEESVEAMITNVAKLREVENSLRTIFSSHQYLEVVLPTFEYVELYTQLDSGFTPDKMFQFINHEGKSIAMRADFTIPIARLYATTAKNTVARYCYFGQVHRKETMHKGRSSELFQSGIELINKPGLSGDQECISIIQEALATLPLKKTMIELGSAKFFSRLCSLVGNKANQLTAILRFKDISGMQSFVQENTFSEELNTLLLQLPTCFGDTMVVHQIKDSIQDALLVESLKELLDVYEALSNKEDIMFDLAMVPSMKYYTGIMIKGYSDQAPSPIISGGRYDKLLPHFDQDVSAIGFCFHMNQILQAMEQEAKNND